MQALQVRATFECVEDIAGALDVDADRRLALDRQVVYRSEMPRLGNAFQCASVNPQSWLCDVPFDQLDASLQRRVSRGELGDPLSSQVGVFDCTRQSASLPVRRRMPGSSARPRNPGNPVINTLIAHPLIECHKIAGSFAGSGSASNNATRRQTSCGRWWVGNHAGSGKVWNGERMTVFSGCASR